MTKIMIIITAHALLGLCRRITSSWHSANAQSQQKALLSHNARYYMSQLMRVKYVSHMRSNSFNMHSSLASGTYGFNICLSFHQLPYLLYTLASLGVCIGSN